MNCSLLAADGVDGFFRCTDTFSGGSVNLDEAGPGFELADDFRPQPLKTRQ